MENPIKMDDLGVPLFWETPICYKSQYWNFITRFHTCIGCPKKSPVDDWELGNQNYEMMSDGLL